MKIDECVLSKLTDEQKKKVEAAQTPEELLTIAKETGYELTQDELEEVSGGYSWKVCKRYDCNVEN
jgi:predicted ribosomally synthesized peptide with nif11-like leader